MMKKFEQLLCSTYLLFEKIFFADSSKNFNNFFLLLLLHFRKGLQIYSGAFSEKLGKIFEAKNFLGIVNVRNLIFFCLLTENTKSFFLYSCPLYLLQLGQGAQSKNNFLSENFQAAADQNFGPNFSCVFVGKLDFTLGFNYKNVFEETQITRDDGEVLLLLGRTSIQAS